MQSSAALRLLNGTGAGKITHVVYIVQENRSFDDLFQAIPARIRSRAARSRRAKTAKLRPVPLTDKYVIDHSAYAMFAACNGTGTLPGTDCRMDGFDNELHVRRTDANPQYVYVPHNESKPYFDMAHEWVVADRMFQSQLDESFVAHQYVIAAQAAVERRSAATASWGCSGGKYDTVATITQDSATSTDRTQQACFDYQTLGDELDKAQLSWRFYASAYGSDVERQRRDVVELSGRQAHLRRTRLEERRHLAELEVHHRRARRASSRTSRGSRRSAPTPITSNCRGGYGPSWVAALVNTVGESKFWDSTAIFVQWDDWGGLYDHVAPPYRGLRRPGLPRSALGDLAVREEGLRLARAVRDGQRAALRRGPLRPRISSRAGRQDARASPADDCFDFSQKPASVREDQGAAAAESSSCSRFDQRLLRSRLRIGHAAASARCSFSGSVPSTA